MGHTHRLALREKGPVTVGTIADTSLLDSTHWRALLKEIRHSLDSSRHRHLRIDFSRVGPLSIEFFAELKSLVEESSRRGGTVHACCLRQDTLEALEAVGVPKTFYLGSKVRHALARYLHQLKHEDEPRIQHRF